MTKPFTRACSLSLSKASVPTRWRTRRAVDVGNQNDGTIHRSAKPMLAMSLSRRLISAGEPAPSTITAWYWLRSRAKESRTAACAVAL